MTDGRAEVLTGVAEIVVAESGGELEAVTEGKSWPDLGVDTLSAMTIVVTAEERFGVRLPEASLRGLTGVTPLVDALLAQRG